MYLKLNVHKHHSYISYRLTDMELPSGEIKTFSGIPSESANDKIIFTVNEFPQTSMQVKLFPKLGNYRLPPPSDQGFPFTFVASSPEFVGLQFDSSGILDFFMT